jgi:hypothetical protein
MFLKELFESTEINQKSVRILGRMNGKIVRKENHSTEQIMNPSAKKKIVESKDSQRYYAVAYNPEDKMRGDIRFNIDAVSNKEAFDMANKEAIRLNKSHVFIERSSGLKIYDGLIKGN